MLNATVSEWVRFERGQGQEDQEPFFRFAGEMWQALGLDLDGKDKDVPWSAAFVSFVVRKAGYQDFRFAAAHSRYIHEAIDKRLQGHTEAPFWGFRLNEHRPKLGDLVCQWRIIPQTFDSAAIQVSFKSHCDVIVELKDTFVRAIGGNVKNSIAMKTYPVDLNGFLKDTKNVFAILRNNF